MDVGVIVPQGWMGEYDGWDARHAWARTMEVAAQAERLGFESLWVFDHFHTHPTPTSEITFESFTTLTALAAQTKRVRLGHIVACAGYRSPALVAKMISMIDAISDGRTELGLGAGWKQDEWVAYGYGYPETRERLEILRDTLEIATRMLGPDQRATYAGKHRQVNQAINVPKPIQQKLPIIVGGNGPNVTWRLAARYADELNLDGLEPAEVWNAIPVIRQRCEEIGRDPASLRLSVNIFWQRSAYAGKSRVELLAAYKDAGVDRVQTLIRAAAETDEALETFAADAINAGAAWTTADT